MKRLLVSLVIAAFGVVVTAVLSHGADVTFDELTCGTSYSFDADSDSAAEAVFTTADSRGFCPNSVTGWIDKGLSGNSGNVLDLEVTFPEGAKGSLQFDFALTNPDGYVYARVLNADGDPIIAGERAYATVPLTGQVYGGQMQLDLGTDVATSAKFNFVTTGGNQYTIDNFRFEVAEDPEPDVLTISLDIKPGNCPNVLDGRSVGELPVAILGTEDFDVTSIDPVSIRLGREGVEDNVAPIKTGMEMQECHLKASSASAVIRLMIVTWT